MSIPGRLDISPTDGLCLDEREALKHFLGKSREEAEGLFFDPANHIYFEDLFWMGDEAFIFYGPTTKAYYLSDESQEDFFAVSQLLLVVEFRLQRGAGKSASAIWECRSELLEIFRYIEKNFDKFFDATLEEYSEDKSRVDQLVRVLALDEQELFWEACEEYKKNCPPPPDLSTILDKYPLLEKDILDLLNELGNEKHP